MRRIMAAALCAAALGMGPVTDARAQDMQDILGRILQGMQGQEDPRQQHPQQWREDGRRPVYSDRWEVQDRLRVLDEADRRLDAEQRRIDQDRRRIEAERRRLTR